MEFISKFCDLEVLTFKGIFGPKVLFETKPPSNGFLSHCVGCPPFYEVYHGSGGRTAVRLPLYPVVGHRQNVCSPSSVHGYHGDPPHNAFEDEIFVRQRLPGYENEIAFSCSEGDVAVLCCCGHPT